MCFILSFCLNSAVKWQSDNKVLAVLPIMARIILIKLIIYKIIILIKMQKIVFTEQCSYVTKVFVIQKALQIY